MSQPWPFSEDGEWDGGRTWRWTSPVGITVEQAKTLTALAPRWTWAVRELHEGGFQFSLTRWNGSEPEEVAPKRRKHRWSNR